MNATETARLCRAIASLAPAQRFDDETPAIWGVVLAGVRYEDAREAIIAISARQPFIAPADIVEEVKKIRRERLARIDDTKITPNVDPDNPADLNAEIAAIRAAIADGRFDQDQYANSGLAISGRPALKAIGDGSKPPELEGRVSLAPARLATALRRPEPPLPVHYSDKPLPPVKAVPPETVERLERERARQFAAMEALMSAQEEATDA